ncbi:hypothetical protein GCM10011613_07090 [Cellvibrio zantedeschiae]|uniref:Signal transduction histidine kinase internal region domain-containing protein n=1 Tax=Cellvibrio zantedeschiae TaxID=1237077 RepID=A0ABQ3AVU9_9GAMM|nr:histidine kinase [Cellvibrio zantedeschiae]GGY65789.1 hypothetical protein GCM10011613_07090 [Cellvibrio zantedeschiae]
MLIWSLLFVLMNAEEKYKEAKHKNSTATTSADIIKAAACLIACRLFEYAVITMSYVPAESKMWLIFSKEYFAYSVISVFFCTLFALFIFFLKPKEALFKSRLLPLIPSILILTFCTTVMSMWGNNLRYRFVHAADNALSPYLFFGGDSLWASPNAFGGAMRECIQDTLIAVLFFLALSFSTRWKLQPNEQVVNFDLKKSIQFWLYNTGGWLLVASGLYFTGLLGLESVDKSSTPVFIFAFVLVGVFMGVSLRTFMRYYQPADFTLLSFTYRLMVMSLLFGFLQACTLWFCNYFYNYLSANTGLIMKYQQFVTTSYYFYTSIFVCVLCCFLWLLIYQISASQRLKVDTTIRQLQLENNMKKIQLSALAGKIDPHFIFNALNNIRALIKEDGEKAREAVLILSDILRSPITTNSQDKVPLAMELGLVRNYIELSKIQLERRLRYEENISVELENVLIPSMMLQIMVENAIKHGISQLHAGGCLHLHIYKEEQTLKCILSNHGMLSSNAKTSGFGVGVANIRERLALLYGSNASFNLHQQQDQVVADLSLPIEYAQ